jgi:hypothetical protein
LEKRRFVIGIMMIVGMRPMGVGSCGCHGVLALTSNLGGRSYAR